ncbi:MAG TPA: ABC transporter permease [Acidimicrobiales bacterium]|nr:ABC transporter permease [Acidimicrobiales bacterium]
MTHALVLLGVVALAALRIWFRRRSRGARGRGAPWRRSGSSGQSGARFRPAGPRDVFERAIGDVGLVAAREIRERTRGRTFRFGTVLILAAVAAAIVIPVVRSTKPGAERIGVVGTLPASLRSAVVAAGASVHTRVTLAPEPDLTAAKRDLRAGAIALVIVDARTIVTAKAVTSSDTSAGAALERTIANAVSLHLAFEAAGITAAQAAALARSTPARVTSLAPAPTHSAARPTSLYGLILLFILLQQYGTWTLMGVLEEKASRVVEVLLATVRPVQLLAGKVLGIGIVALAQAGLVVAFALVLAKAVGSDLLTGAAPVELLSELLWLLLGYAFYCWVYAATGSMAERQDQLQSLTFPLSIPIILGYVTALVAASSGNASTFFKVLAYLPPTAPFAMPVLVGLGGVTWWEFVASVLLSVAATVAMARLAAGVYRRAILRTGRRVALREVFSKART